MSCLWICRKCSKPKPETVDGKPRSGKALVNKLRARGDLPFEVKACKCLGKCKKGPNGIWKPGGKRLHRLTVKEVKRLAASEKSARSPGSRPSASEGGPGN